MYITCIFYVTFFIGCGCCGLCCKGFFVPPYTYACAWRDREKKLNKRFQTINLITLHQHKFVWGEKLNWMLCKEEYVSASSFESVEKIRHFKVECTARLTVFPYGIFRSCGVIISQILLKHWSHDKESISMFYSLLVNCMFIIKFSWNSRIGI